MQRLEPLQNRHLGSKIKIQRTCEKRFFNDDRLVVCKKPLEETPNIQEVRRKYSRSETIFKIGHHAKAIAFANAQFESTIKI